MMNEPNPQSIEADKSAFLQRLEALKGVSGNKALRTELGWENDPDRYWRIQSLLVEDGLIERGRGKGGSVGLVKSKPVVDTETITVPATGAPKESDHYQPVKSVLENSWVKFKAFDNSLVRVTAQQGSKATGGSWTRPDVSVVTFRSFVYFPQIIFDVITFEVKPYPDVKGVFEAISHRESGTQSYVVYVCDPIQFDDHPEGARAIEVAKRYGIGVIVTDSAGDWDAWDERLSAERVQPNVEKIDKFLRETFGEEDRNQIIKWQKK